MNSNQKVINSIKIKLMLSLSLKALRLNMCQLIKSKDLTNGPYEIWSFLKTNYPKYKSDNHLKECLSPLKDYFEKKTF